MIDPNTFIEDFLKHEYDPVKARAYYLRTRKLKGREPGKGESKANPQSTKTFEGGPLPKLGTRMEEDQTPSVSPSGAKLVDYNGRGLGKATYADGTVYDAAVGWKKVKSSDVVEAKVRNDAQKAESLKKQDANPTLKRRIGQAEQKLIRARTLANKLANPVAKKEMLDKIRIAETRLKNLQADRLPNRRLP